MFECRYVYYSGNRHLFLETYSWKPTPRSISQSYSVVVADFRITTATHHRELGSIFPRNSPESNHRRHRPLRLKKKTSFVTLAFSLAALPLWAAHSYSADLSPTKPTTVGTIQLQPGEYKLKAEDGKSELQIVHKGKVVGTVPVHWIT